MKLIPDQGQRNSASFYADNVINEANDETGALMMTRTDYITLKTNDDTELENEDV